MNVCVPLFQTQLDFPAWTNTCRGCVVKVLVAKLAPTCVFKTHAFQAQEGRGRLLEYYSPSTANIKQVS